MKKQQESEEIRESKEQIDDTVKKVSEYNATYIRELERKNAEIE